MIPQELQNHVVVITDDSELERRRVKDSLAKATSSTISVHEAESGSEVENLLNRLVEEDKFPAVILLDFVLGGTNGISVAEHVRKHYPPIPIIVFGSCIGSDENITELYRLGVNAYFVKPQTQAAYDEALKKIADIWLHIPQPLWSLRRVSNGLNHVDRNPSDRRKINRRGDARRIITRS